MDSIKPVKRVCDTLFVDELNITVSPQTKAISNKEIIPGDTNSKLCLFVFVRMPQMPEMKFANLLERSQIQKSYKLLPSFLCDLEVVFCA